MKIKNESGVMDIQRQAFEAQHSDKIFKIVKFDTSKNGYVLHDHLGLTAINLSALAEINYGWDVWQAAQKVAVPEGFVLVKRNLTNAAAHAAKSVDGRLSAFKYSDVWDAMIEAQEQVG